MEPVRPLVDRYLIGLLAGRTFAARDFFETRTGVCRVTPPLTSELAATIPSWERLVLPVAQDVARHLVSDAGQPSPYRRPRRAAAPINRERQSPVRAAPRVRTPRKRCVVCGEPVRRQADRTCGVACETAARVAAGHAGAGELLRRLERLRAEGRDPTATAVARRKLGESNARRQAERRAWEREHPGPHDPERYRREILPGVAAMSLKEITRRTGLSLRQAADIKRGRVVPHPRWEALTAVE